ncbi:hypothetical protein COE51_16340 [Bacillus pseudomycoides]|nr:hypothetical protein COE51_16340 [Bacillus pseudomycoides]
MTYQQSRFLNLMQDYGKSVELYEKSLNSTGIAQQKFELYQQSTEASLNRLKNAFESTWNNAFKSDGIRTAIDAITGFMNGVSKLTQTLGILPVTIGVISTGFLLFGTRLESTMARGRAMGTVIKTLATDFNTLSFSMAASQAKMTAGARANAILSASFTTLGNAAKGALAFMGGALLPVAGMMALGFAIQKVTEAFIKQREEAQKLKQENEDIAKSYATNGQEIDKLVSSYAQLSTKKDKGVGLNTDETKQYLDVQNQLNKLMPILTQNVDDQGQAHLRSVESIKTEITYAKELSKAYSTEYLAKFEDETQKAISKMGELKDKIKETRNPTPTAIDWKAGVPKTDGQKAETERMAVEYERELALQQQKLAESAQKRVQAFNEVNQVTKFLNNTDTEYINKQIEAKQATLKTAEDVMKLSGHYIDLAQSVGEINKALGTKMSVQYFDELLKGKDITKEQTQAIINYGEALKKGEISERDFSTILTKAGIKGEQLKSVMDTLSGALNNNGQSAQNAAQDTNIFSAALEENSKSKSKNITMSELLYGVSGDLISQIQMATRVVEILSGVENLNEQQTYALKQAKDFLSSVFPQLNGEIDTHMDWIKAETKAYSIINDATATTADTQMANEYLKTQNTIANVKARIQALERERQALEDIANASVGVEGDNHVERMYKGVDHLNDNLSDLQGQLSQAVNRANELANKINNMDKPGSKSGSSGGSSGGSGGSGGKTDADREREKAEQDAKKAEEERLRNQQQFAQDLIAIYKEAYQKQKDIALSALEQEKSAYEKWHNERLKQIDDELKKYEDSVNKKLALLDKENAAQDYNKNLAKEQQKRQEIVNQINKLSLDNSVAGKAKLMDLTKQLQQQEETIANMQTDRNRQLEKDNLNNLLKNKQDSIQAQKDQLEQDNTKKQEYFDQKQKQTERYYDNLLNDQRKYDYIDYTVDKHDPAWIPGDLKAFRDQIQKNLGIVGESVGQTLIDSINNALNHLSKGNYTPLRPKGFDTGGYTGSFGSEGKIALLHEKELVLNKSDTKNVLDIIGMVRNMSAKLPLPQLNTPNLAVASPSSGNTFKIDNVNFNFDKLMGGVEGANSLVSNFVKGIKMLGGDI